MSFLSDAVRLAYHTLPTEEQAAWEARFREIQSAGLRVMVLSTTRGDLGSEVIIRVYE